MTTDLDGLADSIIMTSSIAWAKKAASQTHDHIGLLSNLNRLKNHWKIPQ